MEFQYYIIHDCIELSTSQNKQNAKEKLFSTWHYSLSTLSKYLIIYAYFAINFKYVFLFVF